MSKMNALLDILQKIYFILQQYHMQNSGQLTRLDDYQMTRQEVKDYLGISESTYKRMVKQGRLLPLKRPGGDRFYRSQLEDEYRESVRKGRV